MSIVLVRTVTMKLRLKQLGKNNHATLRPTLDGNHDNQVKTIKNPTQTKPYPYIYIYIYIYIYVGQPLYMHTVHTCTCTFRWTTVLTKYAVKKLCQHKTPLNMPETESFRCRFIHGLYMYVV